MSNELEQTSKMKDPGFNEYGYHRCGYCRTMIRNRGGNKAYRCKNHRKISGVRKITLYTEKQLQERISQAEEAAREGERDKIKKGLRKLVMCNICGGKEIVDKLIKSKE